MRHYTPSRIAAGALAIGLAWSCGGGGGGGGGGPTGPDGPLPAALTVNAQGPPFAFAPRVAELAVGGVVTFTNSTTVVHPLATSSPNWDNQLSAIGPGQTMVATFTRPGNYPYRCLAHPEMNGTILVR